MTQDMGNNISYCSKALAREMARSKQALGRLISMLRDCSATLRPQVRECLHFATPHSDQWSENAWSMARIWSENVFVRKERTLSPSRTNSQSVGHELRFIRYAAVLILMMVVGVSEIRGQHPFTLTTASDITNGTQHYYLIQSIERPSFYAISQSNSDNAKVSTTSIPNANMRWCFVDAGSDSDHQYYYIVNSTGRCLYRSRDDGGNDGIRIKNTYANLSGLADDELNKYKFYLTQTGSDYFIQPKGFPGQYLNKRAGNVRYENNYYIKPSTYNDAPSVWNFVAVGSVTWTQPFTVSTNSEKHYYKFQNVTNTSFYLSNSDEWATVSSAGGDKDIWYFLAAGNDATYSNCHYYYIVNAATGKYLYHTGGTGDDVAKVMNYNSAEDDNYRFLIVDAAYKPDNTNFATGYTIVPKLRQTYFYDKDSYAPMAMSDGSHLLLKSDRVLTVNNVLTTNYDSHWDIVETDYVAVEAPTITNNFDGTISLSTTTDGATIYYTTNGDTPDNTSTEYSSAFSLGNAKVIKAIAYVGAVSSDVTTYNVPQYTTPTITFDNTTSQVTITCTDATGIYYTTGDGSQADPTISSTPYSNSFDVVSPTTVKAIAIHAGYLSSEVATLAIAQVATPTIDFNDETYTITLASATTGSTIYFRIGTTGDFSSYEDPFVVGPGNTIYAYAAKDGCINSETISFVAPVLCAPPVFTVTESTISIACSTDGSEIYYTEDGTDPDMDPGATVTPTLYEGPISATERKIIKAIAVSGSDQSGVVTLFNRPAIVLSENAEKAAANVVLSDDTYTYDGTAKEPYVMMVAIKKIEAAAADYSVSYSNNTEAGTATVTLTDNEGNNIVIKNASTTFTINKAPLTVTADDKNIAYGGAAPAAYTISYTGFVNSETEATEGVITTAPTAACTYVTGNDAGTYPIVPSGGGAKNYSLVYHNGTLTVGPKVVKDDPNTEAGESQITIVLKEDDNVVTGDTYTYDGTAKEPTVTVKDGDTEIAASEYTVAYTHNTNAGSGATGPTVTITDKAGGNYAVSGVQTFTIKKASLTVKANDVSAIYGSLPVYTFSYTGFIEGETAETAITTPPTVSCEYPSVHNDVGTYDIVPSGGEAPNYELTYVEGACKGTLTVDPKTVKDNPDTEAGESAVTIELSGIPEDGYVYDGTAKEPTVTVKDGDTVIDDDEYTVGYSNNTNAGTEATVTITDNTGGNYIVSGETTFTIHSKSIGDGTQPETGYTVSEPTKDGDNYSVTVKEGETTLTEGVHYELEVSTVSNATYTVYANEIVSIMVKGKGNYGGSVLRIYGTLTYWSSGETGENKQNVSPFVATEANLDSPDGVTPYIISGINMTKHELKLKAVSYIPKDVPVLLLTGALADPDDGMKTASFIPMPKEVEEGSEEDTSMNLLKVSEGQAVGAGQTYALYHGKFWLTGSGTLTEGKFYFDNPNYQSTTVTETVSPAPPMRLVFEDMTGVEEVRRMMDDGRNDRWYTLDGRQLQGKPAKKGLYIKNGQKIVVME